MTPGFGGPRPSWFGGFGGSSSGGFRRNWDSPPDDKKAEDKKPAAKEPAKKPVPEKKPTPPKQEARGYGEAPALVLATIGDLVDRFRPRFDVRLPQIDFSLVGLLLAEEKDRPAPPAPPHEGKRPDAKEGPRGPGGFGHPDGRRPDGPAPGGPVHGGPGHNPAAAGGHSPGPWGFFDPERFKEADPELYGVWKEEHELEKKTFELGEQYRRTKDAGEKEKLKQALAEQVGKHFDVRQKKRELELKRFVEHLERMKASIAKRQEAKASIVQERVDELTGEDDTKF